MRCVWASFRHLVWRRHAIALVAVISIGMAAQLTLRASSARAAQTSSSNVAVINGEGAGDGGDLPEYGTVDGSPSDDFGQFTFTDLSDDEIDSSDLAGYDTIVLNQVFTSDLDAAQEQTLGNFVTSGGKLIILDADGTDGNDYSWLPVPAGTGTSCENCGNTDGTLEINESSALISSDPTSPDYVDVGELPGNTDAAGDANVLLTSDPRWDKAVTVSNDSNVSGAAVAYATDGGLIVYDGLDTDDIGDDEPSGNDWVAKLYFQALALPWDPDGLPHSVPITASGCGQRAVTVGAVSVCASSITDGDTDSAGNPVLEATGNVTLDGGVSVGNGPIEIDQTEQTITAAAPAPITVGQAAGPVSLGSAAFTIATASTTDPGSGTAKVALVQLGKAALSVGGLTVGGLSVELPDAVGAKLYLDPAHGGGLIGTATVTLSVLGQHPGGGLSVGIYAGRPGITPLGGTLSLPSFTLANGWGFDGLTLTYQAASNSWSASGGFSAPIGSLDVSGSVVGGGLNSIGASIGGQAVPLGDSGFFFSGFGGSINGLASGPLSLTAKTSGFWGAPEGGSDPVEPFYLNNVALTISLAGSVSLDGAVSFVLQKDSPISGDLHLNLGLSPFQASGSVSVDGHVPTISFTGTDSVGFTPRHFTAQGAAQLSAGLLSGAGTEVASDAGFGASGKLCAKSFLGIKACVNTGIVVRWSQLSQLIHGDLGVLKQMIGSDPSSLVTVADETNTGASQTEAFPVRPGRTMLLVSAIGAGHAPRLVLTTPGGNRLVHSSRPFRTLFGHQSGEPVSEILVIRPSAGTWRLAWGGRTAPRSVHVTTLHQTVPLQAQKVVVRHLRHGHHHGTIVRLRWGSTGLPRDVRVAIVEIHHQNAIVGGRVLKAGLPDHGTLSLALRTLGKGSDSFVLVATERGVPFQRVAVPASCAADELGEVAPHDLRVATRLICQAARWSLGAKITSHCAAASATPEAVSAPHFGGPDTDARTRVCEGVPLSAIAPAA